MKSLQPYQEFQDSLLQMKEHLASERCDLSTLDTHLTQLKTILQQQIQPLLDQEWHPHLLQRLQSYQVEIDKQLRLAKLDLLFVRSAQSGPTRQQRLLHLQERLDKLEQYCTAILSSAPTSSNPI
jgi:chromosome segregation ATPase